MLMNLFRWSLVRQLRTEVQAAEAAGSALCQRDWVRRLAVTHACCKKRRSQEEKIAESHGRRVIRYSPKAGSEVVGIWRDMTVKDVAQVLGKDVEHIFKALEFADKTQRQYGADTVIAEQRVVRDLVKICGCRFKLVAPPDRPQPEDQNRDAVPLGPAPPSALRPRPPVVCIMGHVDHGKTTLLDALRDSAIVDQEFGGITQHIGAFEVRVPSGESVTFVDTPGHAAFVAMRARGAHATDIVALVVAADDGVMEQTVEAIRMAREANVPILVVINKIDKPGVDIEKTLRGLAQHGVVCEALGGEVQAVQVSALRRRGLEQLLEALALQAQILELRADYGGPVEGVVLETNIDPVHGKQASVLVRRGTLRPGCVVVAGLGWARVRALRGCQGEEGRKEAPPSAAARVLGWRALPQPGDTLLEVPTEKRAHEVIRWRQAQRMKEKQHEDAEAIEAKETEHQTAYRAQLAHKRAQGRMRLRRVGPRPKEIRDDHHPTLSVLIKGDVEGSVEAVLDIVETYEDHERVRLDVVHAAVGPLTPGDVEVASAFGALVLLLNAAVPAAVAAEARAKGVQVREHSVIYRLVEELKRELGRLLPPTRHEEVVGEANVLQTFLVSEGEGSRRKVPVAGARVAKGALHRDHAYRLLRQGKVLFDGKLASMKHLKEEVSSVSRGMECGLRLRVEAGAEPPQPQPGDTLLCYRIVETPQDTPWDPGF